MIHITPDPKSTNEEIKEIFDPVYHPMYPTDSTALKSHLTSAQSVEHIHREGQLEEEIKQLKEEVKYWKDIVTQTSDLFGDTFYYDQVGSNEGDKQFVKLPGLVRKLLDKSELMKNFIQDVLLNW